MTLAGLVDQPARFADFVDQLRHPPVAAGRGNAPAICAAPGRAQAEPRARKSRDHGADLSRLDPQARPYARSDTGEIASEAGDYFYERPTVDDALEALDEEMNRGRPRLNPEAAAQVEERGSASAPAARGAGSRRARRGPDENGRYRGQGARPGCGSFSC